MSSTLNAVCTSLPEFFDQLETFVTQLGGKLRIGLGSIGESGCKLWVQAADFPGHEDYRNYREVSLTGAAALLTSLTIEQDGRSLEFRLSDWESCVLPVVFDAKAVPRAWLTHLANNFDLQNRIHQSSAASAGNDQGAAYLQAIKHFEESTTTVNQAAAAMESTVRAMVGDAAKLLAEQRQSFANALESETESRRQRFEQSLQESDQIDVRRHGIARRHLMERLESMANEELLESESPVSLGSRRVVATLSCVMMLVGTLLITSVSVLHPMILASVGDSTRQQLETVMRMGLPTGWAQGATLVAGFTLLVAGGFLWIRQLIRVQRRSEEHFDRARKFKRDLVRMGWLSELYLEACETTEPRNARDAVPEVLLDRFSRSLFADGDELFSTDDERELDSLVTSVAAGSPEDSTVTTV